MIEKFIEYIKNREKEYIIFDIGSRDCIQSIEFYNNFPNSKIYAFECNPNTLETCRKNIEKYSDRITLIEGAVCDYDGEITFYPINQKKTTTTWKDGNPGASSIFKSNGQYTVENYVQDEITTNCHRLDTVMKKYNIERVDIIWMDLQGAELLALEGLGKFLDTVDYIHTEVSYKEIYSGQVMFNELNDFILSKNFVIQNDLKRCGWQEDIIYKRECSLFDIVIMVGPHDKDVIRAQVEFTKKNIIGYRNIYLVSFDPTINVNGCITIDEKIFPFNIDTVAAFHEKNDRNGWYLQQLLKLYSCNVIPHIMDRYLVIDSDTFFIKKTHFIENNRPLYCLGFEYNVPYFEHIARLDNEIVRVDPRFSGICHHMMFEKKYVNEIFERVENKHRDLFYNVFLKLVDGKHITGSGASEYELYFNYMLIFHSDKIKLRFLKWMNSEKIIVNKDLSFVSRHWHLRK